MKELRDRLQVMESERDAANTTLSTKLSNATEMEAQLQELHQQLETLTTTTTTLAKEKASLSEELDARNEELNLVKNERSALEDESNNSKSAAAQLSALTSELQQKGTEIESLQSKLAASSDDALSQVTDLQQRLQQAETQLSEVEQQRSSIQEQYVELKEDMAISQKTIADLNEKATQSSTKALDVEERLNDAISNLEAEREERKKLESALDNVQKKHKDENEQRQRYEGSMLSLEREKVKLEGDLAKLRTQLTKVVNQANQKVEQKDKTIKDMEHKMSQEHQSKEVLRKQMEMYMRDLSAKVTAVEYEMVSMIDKHEQLVIELNDKIKQTEEASLTLQEELQYQLDNALNEAKRVDAEASAASENAVEELEQERARLASAEADRREASEELLAMAQMIKDLESRLRGQEEETRSSEEALRNYRARANTLLKQKDREIESMLGGYVSTWPQPVLDLIQQHEQSVADANASQKEAEEELHSMANQLKRAEESYESAGEDLKLMTMQVEAAQNSKSAMMNRMRDLEKELAELRINLSSSPLKTDGASSAAIAESVGATAAQVRLDETPSHMHIVFLYVF